MDHARAMDAKAHVLDLPRGSQSIPIGPRVIEFQTRKIRPTSRAELSAIRLAVDILERRGCLDEDIVVYSDSDYSIKCVSTWVTGWISRGWKTSDGKNVSHRDLIEDIAKRMSKFKTHRFVHVKAHTGNSDDLSIQNDRVDRMAREAVEGKKEIVVPPPSAEIVAGCPLAILGPPVAQGELLHWMREHLDTFDRDSIDKHLYKAFQEVCKTRSITLTKHVSQRATMLRAELTNVSIEKVS
jgi:ribonuclease HI